MLDEKNREGFNNPDEIDMREVVTEEVDGQEEDEDAEVEIVDDDNDDYEDTCYTRKNWELEILFRCYVF